MSTRNFSPLLPLAALVLLFAGGCSDIQKRSYEVVVKNESNAPVTVWLTKDGGLFEPGWRSPEQYAYETRGLNEQLAEPRIQPGQSLSIGPMEGEFYPRTAAVLRVYLGEHTFSDLLAISQGATDRKDYELNVGYNGFRIIEKDGVTLVQRVREPMSMTTEAK